MDLHAISNHSLLVRITHITPQISSYCDIRTIMKTRHTVLGMLASAIVAFQMGSLLSAWSHLSPSFTAQISLAASEREPPLRGSAPGDAVRMKDEKQKQSNLTQEDPLYWIADEQDDFYERIYVDPTVVLYNNTRSTVRRLT